MAYWVANHLHMRPNDIIYNWGVAELIVTYGHYTNIIVGERYAEWKNKSVKEKSGQKVPPEYNVLFYSRDQIDGNDDEE